MATARTIRCRHSPNGRIQWLRVKPWMLDVLYRAMRPVSYRRISMAFEVANDLPAFFVVANLLLPTNIAKYYSNS